MVRKKPLGELGPARRTLVEDAPAQNEIDPIAAATAAKLSKRGKQLLKWHFMQLYLAFNGCSRFLQGTAA